MFLVQNFKYIHDYFATQNECVLKFCFYFLNKPPFWGFFFKIGCTLFKIPMMSGVEYCLSTSQVV